MKNMKQCGGEPTCSVEPIRNDVSAVILLGKFVRDVVANPRIPIEVCRDAAMLVRSLQRERI
ncbi:MULTISPECIES: hypothetical protein [Burkholderia]|uniref:hypothetical protein n=1 Tax=Burkholderia TaxID=32008 RepID=UPI0005A1744C|nr:MULTISPECIES: hypothetical protein [Burkholderia]KVR90852.1 hypothetical protein WK28_21355 [Burkholderia vietnamiensis]HDR8992371.1 hypothetical protein [Burkholderia vietnamiensis]HDR9085373.1 hypothetical protein [Burkholderia vietnamiensis]HDR9182245.1 hypothetical protein [Burkholderia vietnamiensis]